MLEQVKHVVLYNDMAINTLCVGGACCVRVLRSLQQHFSTAATAEEFFTNSRNKENISSSTEQPEGSLQPPLPPHEEFSAHHHNPDSTKQSEGQHTLFFANEDEASSGGSCPIQSVDMLKPSIAQLCQMEPEEHLAFVSEIFAAYCSRENISVPQDFIQFAVRGMVQLHATGRCTILYSLAKCLGSQRSDASDSVFPCKQLVAGICSIVSIFVASHVGQVCVVCMHADVHICRLQFRLSAQMTTEHGYNRWV